MTGADTMKGGGDSMKASDTMKGEPAKP
jgi:hypothetical protein